MVANNRTQRTNSAIVTAVISGLMRLSRCERASADDRQRDQREDDRIDPFGEAAVQLGAKDCGCSLYMLVVRVRIEQVGQRRPSGYSFGVAATPGEHRQVEGVGQEADDRDVALPAILR